ncbi:type II secretion system F family protein [soil metagenome]
MRWDDWVIDHARTASKAHRKIAQDDLLAFFQTLATLVSSGTPLLQSLQIAGQQSESLGLRSVLAEIIDRVSAGSSFHEAAAQYPNAFEFSWVEVIRTGEVTGKMGHVLAELNRQVREARETRRKIIGALTYPVILVFVAILAITAMLWFVVPTFTTMFDEMGAELPAITRFVVAASDFMLAHGFAIASGVMGLVLVARKFYATESGRRSVQGMLMVLPTFGDLMVQAAMYRFTSNLSLLLKSGVPMLETLTTIRGIFEKSPIYRDAITRAQSRVAAGQPLSGALEETRLFTGMVVNMVQTGEESGRLGEVMESIAPYYKEKMESLISKVSKMLEPLIIIGMGSAVAGMMISIYLPMFEMSGNVR